MQSVLEQFLGLSSHFMIILSLSFWWYVTRDSEALVIEVFKVCRPHILK